MHLKVQLAVPNMTSFIESLVVTITAAIVLVPNAIESSILFTKGKKKENHEILILSLSLSDIAVAVSVFTFRLYLIIFLEASSLTSFQIGTFGIYAAVSIQFSTYASLFHVIGITVDRYIAIRYPFRHKIWITPYRTRLFTIIAWLISLIVASGSIAWAVCQAGYTLLANTIISRFLAAVGLSGGCLVALSYIFITKAVIDSRKNSSSRGGKRNSLCNKERRLLAVSFAIVLSFFVCVFPFSVEVFVRDIESVYTCMFLLTNSIINPLIYFYGSRKK